MATHWPELTKMYEAAAVRALSIREEQGFPFIRDHAGIMLGRARAHLGSAGQGVSLIYKGLAGLEESGARLAMTDSLTQLAEAQTLDGRIDDALETVERALQVNPEKVFWRPGASFSLSLPATSDKAAGLIFTQSSARCQGYADKA